VRCNWFVATLGGDVLPMVPIAVAMGGHVRVGLEDYQYTRDGQFSNAQLVERAAAIIKGMGHEIASTREARQMLDV
jgi:3-keto-5-aminohexanoate cleavage enzyme